MQQNAAFSHYSPHSYSDEPLKCYAQYYVTRYEVDEPDLGQRNLMEFVQSSGDVQTSHEILSGHPHTNHRYHLISAKVR